MAVNLRLRLKNQLTQTAVAKECAQWVKKKAIFKSNKHHQRPIIGTIHIQNGEQSAYAYNNLEGFTTSDLGITHKGGFPTIIQRTDFPNSQAYLEYFDQIWANDEDLTDVSKKVQDFFESAYKDNSPEFIYFITLLTIFLTTFLQDLSLDNLPNDQIGFKGSFAHLEQTI